MAMSFLERAKQQAEQAAQKAREAATTAAQQAGASARTMSASVQEAASNTQAQLQDPTTREKAKQTLQRAKKGVSTAIDRIDPGVLADVIIKATALQERTNASLRAKGSVYRVQEVVIGASIPPAISFAIARIGEKPDEAADGALSSEELMVEVADQRGTIQALDGSEIDEASLLDDEGVPAASLAPLP
jgi:hypothetical protein